MRSTGVSHGGDGSGGGGGGSVGNSVLFHTCVTLYLRCSGSG